MIENISINNYALIDHTHIELEKGFSVIIVAAAPR